MRRRAGNGVSRWPDGHLGTSNSGSRRLSPGRRDPSLRPDGPVATVRTETRWISLTNRKDAHGKHGHRRQRGERDEAVRLRTRRCAEGRRDRRARGVRHDRPHQGRVRPAVGDRIPSRCAAPLPPQRRPGDSRTTTWPRSCRTWARSAPRVSRRTSRRRCEYLGAAGFSASQTGIVGFCLGGSVVVLAAARHALGAAVTFYGGGIAAGRFGMPPLAELAPELKTPWLGLFGDLDQSIPSDQVEAMRERGEEGLGTDRSRSIRRRHARLPLRCPRLIPRGVCAGRLAAHARVVRRTHGEGLTGAPGRRRGTAGTRLDTTRAETITDGRMVTKELATWVARASLRRPARGRRGRSRPGLRRLPR